MSGAQSARTPATVFGLRSATVAAMSPPSDVPQVIVFLTPAMPPLRM